ncbi:nitroreductase [Diaphorobacter sp. HDW4A]|uniref:nitroreductase n=1 Tax=Diaphorobacter sp. HDW4A TaxID=2714924 RepID=UPI0014082F5C|nr:nitroreductase [Diaphorobacter sp. HDW4A]QIL80435.1 nitroreductase [Diaphorobacter sp. HDW4A]
MSESTPSNTIAEALCFLHQRRSIRAFTDQPVEKALLTQVLQAARAAPSGANLQPGRFIQVSGDVRAALTRALMHNRRQFVEEREDYDYFPRPMPMQLRKRQVAAAQALYSALGIARDDTQGRESQFARNYQFFDAPVALIVTIDANFGAGGYMDLGMALHGLQLAASVLGMGSCAIGAMASHANTVREVLRLPSDQHIVCGLALGWPDEKAPVNQTETRRIPLDMYFEQRSEIHTDPEKPSAYRPTSEANFQ